MRVPEEREAEGTERLFKDTMEENFPNSGKSRTSEYKELTQPLHSSTQKDVLQEMLH